MGDVRDEDHSRDLDGGLEDLGFPPAPHFEELFPSPERAGESSILDSIEGEQTHKEWRRNNVDLAEDLVDMTDSPSLHVLPPQSARALRRVREEAGLSREQVSAATEVPVEVLRGLEEGDVLQFSEETLERVLEVLRNPNPSPMGVTKTPVARGESRLGLDWEKQPLGRVADHVLAEQLGVNIQRVEDERRARKIPRHDAESARRRAQIDWDVVAPFLGKVPDDVLAGKLNTSRKSIGEKRKERNIPPWSRGDRKMSLDGLADGSWYLDKRTLLERSDEVAKLLDAEKTITVPELLKRFKLSLSLSNERDAIHILEALRWKLRPDGAWVRPGTRAKLRNSGEIEADKAAVLAYLRATPGWRASSEVVRACKVTQSQAITTLQHLEEDGSIIAIGQARARRYLAV